MTPGRCFVARALSAFLLACVEDPEGNLFDRFEQLVLGLPRSAIALWVVEHADWCVLLGTPTARHEGGTITIRWRDMDLECLPNCSAAEEEGRFT